MSDEWISRPDGPGYHWMRLAPTVHGASVVWIDEAGAVRGIGGERWSEQALASAQFARVAPHPRTGVNPLAHVVESLRAENERMRAQLERAREVLR